MARDINGQETSVNGYSKYWKNEWNALTVQIKCCWSINYFLNTYLNKKGKESKQFFSLYQLLHLL